MKTYLDCLPCLFNQSLKAARAATDDEKIHRQVMDRLAITIPELSLNVSPPEIAQGVYRMISQVTGNKDPFKKEKNEANDSALALYPRMKKLVEESPDNLFTACKLALMGNSLDLAPDFKHGGIDVILEEVKSCKLAINHYDRFLKSLNTSKILLYIGDNAGEIVFDRLLIEEIQKSFPCDIYFAVRGKPVINDATREDAIQIGIDKVAKIISNGTDAPGTLLSRSSAEFLRLYYGADTIISKGQGNFETLEGERKNIFFFLRAKCPVVAKILGTDIGECVLKR